MVLNSNEWFGWDKHKSSRGLRHECIAVYFVLKSLLSFFTHAQNAPTQLLLGTDHYFFDGGGGSGKFWNKLFAEAVNTEINSMQVKKKVFAGKRRHTQKNCLQREPHIKKCLHLKIFHPPHQKKNGPSLMKYSATQPFYVSSRNAPPHKALRDDTKNGYVADCMKGIAWKTKFTRKQKP